MENERQRPRQKAMRLRIKKTRRVSGIDTSVFYYDVSSVENVDELVGICRVLQKNNVDLGPEMWAIDAGLRILAS